ncbi:MAG: ATP-binding protein [Crenarchaeota archaeon]|nr:ATP-binding protein [Thermoproteota archaeon]
MAGQPILVDREQELEALDAAWEAGQPVLAVVYGRRRVGKTFLVTGWAALRGLDTIYLVANFSDPQPALRDLEEQLGEQLGFPPRLSSLRDLVKTLAALFCSSRRVIVFDEFQRLAAAGLPQLLQEAWDRRLSGCPTPSMLVLSGSAVGMIERAALHGGSPLYGRARLTLRLRPLGFREAYPMLRGAPSSVEAFRLYALFGGTPYYLSLLSPGEGVEGNLWRLLFAPGAPLQEEPRRVLEAEVREPDRYMAILEALARGGRRLGDIAAATGLPPTSLPRYIQVLESMDLVCRQRILETSRHLYRVCDNFFQAWFRLIAPRLHLLERGLNRQAYTSALREAETLAAQAWEAEALRDLLHRLQARGEEPLEAGAYIHKGIEIDGVIVTADGTLYGLEAKWSRLTPRELERLHARLEAKLRQTPMARRARRIETIVYAREVEGEKPPNTYTLRDLAEAGEATRVHPIPGRAYGI